MLLYIDENCPHCQGSGEVTHDTGIGSYVARCDCVRNVTELFVLSFARGDSDLVGVYTSRERAQAINDKHKNECAFVIDAVPVDE